MKERYESYLTIIAVCTCLWTGQLAADRPLLGRDACLGLPLLSMMLHEKPLVRLCRVVRSQVRRDQKELRVEGQFDVEAAVLLLHPFQRFQVLFPLNLLQLPAGCLLEMQSRQRLLEVLLDSPSVYRSCSFCANVLYYSIFLYFDQ